MRRRLWACAGLTGIAALLASSVPANAVNGNLPGGTNISVNITGPAENAVLAPGRLVEALVEARRGQSILQPSVTAKVARGGPPAAGGHTAAGDRVAVRELWVRESRFRYRGRNHH